MATQQLGQFSNRALEREVALIEYDAELENIPVDRFGPVSEGEHLTLPDHL